MHARDAPQGRAAGYNCGHAPRARLLRFCVLLWPGLARGGEIWPRSLRASSWAEADALAAAASPDPVARKLVLYYRLLTPGAARSAEIAAFMADNPDWPNAGALLSRRLAEALLLDRDDRAVLRDLPRAARRTRRRRLLRCADAAMRTSAAAGGMMRAGPGCAASPTRRRRPAFMRNGAGRSPPDDQLPPVRPPGLDRAGVAECGAWPGRRSGSTRRPAGGRGAAGAAARRPGRPGAVHRPARGGAHRSRPRARPGPLAIAAPSDDRRAARVWTERGAAAEAAAPAERQGAFWDERNLLARRLLREP